MDPGGNLGKLYDPESQKTIRELFKEKHVKIVTDNDVEKIGGHKPGMLLVYRDSCVWCQSAKFGYAQFGYESYKWNQTHKTSQITVMAMDSTLEENQKFMMKNNIRGVPAIFVCNPTEKGYVYEPYNGERSAQAFWNVIQKVIYANNKK